MMYQDEIREGIAFLNAEYPGWRQKMNWEALNMYRNCVLDQVDPGGYTKAVDTHSGDEGRLDWAARHGFDLYTNEGNYGTLTQEWKVYANATD